MHHRAGDQVNHYTLLEPLGEGGQGSVWKVLDPRGGGVERALKIVSLSETGPSAFDRARREARILAGASHPALVTCHGFFEERDGIVGLLMDLVPGRSLADALEARRLDRNQGLAVLGHLADALAYVHGAGLVHRDLKPENILLTDDFWTDAMRAGSVKLVDFGIAASADNATQLTRTGTVIGTLPYLAPELIDPATWGRTEGPARDIFAFGVLACRLLLGRHPTGLGFDASMIDYARAYTAAQAGRLAWPPPGIEGRWGAIVGACLALRSGARPATGAALLDMLHAAASSRREPRGATANPTSPYTMPPHEAPTELARPLAGARTAPVHVKTIPAGPSTAAMRAPGAGSRGWVGVALLVVGGLGAVGGALAFSTLGGASSAPPASPLSDTPAPTPQEAPAAPPAAAAGPCRNPDIHFDARDTRFACPPCAGKAPSLPAGSWYMRVHGVTGPTPMPRSGLPKKVCAQVTGGQPMCVPFLDLPDRTGALGRIRVTSADLDSGRVYFSIRDAEGILAQGFGHRRAGTTGFRESALCSGFVLVLDDADVTLSVFLDDR
jgi:serine/threonine-protein kinase